MKNASRVIRGANFAYPWSERADYFSPRKVQLLIGISAIMVLALVALPFLLRDLERNVLRERGLANVYANTQRLAAAEAAPILARKAVLDSLMANLGIRINLRNQIDDADYPVDRLLLHISELVPDDLHLTNITIQPPSARQDTRLAALTQNEEIPEEIQIAYTITIEGSAGNSDILTGFYNAIDQSPLFWGRTDSIQPRERTLDFTINCYLPGTGFEITGEGG